MAVRKVVIIGDGAVGSSIAFTLTQTSLVTELIIIDVNKDKAEGDALDLNHGMTLATPKIIKAGNYKDIKDAKVIILACGVSQKPGETRLELLNRNKKIFDQVIASMRPNLDRDAIILVVSNPVDILAYYVGTHLGFPMNQVIGSGTVLDTARLKYLLSQETGIDPRSIHAYVIGEHGDSEVAAFSVTSVAGLSIDKLHEIYNQEDVCTPEHLESMEQDVKNAAYEIIQKKGATYYGIAMATKRILEAILNDQHSVLTVSTYLENEFDGRISDVYLSVPVVLGINGVEKIVRPDYSEDEINRLVESANVLKLKR